MRPSLSTCAIAVMAKAPQPGRSKTRMCPPLTHADAAALSAAFLRDTTDNLAEAARRAPIAPYAAYAPAGSEPLLIPHLARGTALILADGTLPVPAGVEGFGRALFHAVVGLFEAGHAAACVLSSDSPTLPTERLVAAAEILLAPGDRAVLGPADDGGYYLLGVKAPHARLFADIAWSTERVAEQTRARAKDAGLELRELPPWSDTDDAAALVRVVSDDAGYGAPMTRAVVRRLAGAGTLSLRVPA